jgi:hypothetical protein
MPIQWNGRPPVPNRLVTPDTYDYFKNLDIGGNDGGGNRKKNNDSNAATRESRELTIKGVEADEDQRANMETVISTAREVKGSTDLAVLSVICAVIQESACRNLKGGDASSSGVLQVLASTGDSHNVNPRDIEAVVKEYMTEGYYMYGSAISLAKNHKDYSPGEIAWRVQGPAAQYRGEYAKWEPEARKWLQAAKGGQIEGGPNTYRKPYKFERKKNENSWDCMSRLAEEVNWKVFPVGRTMYYMSEVDLFRRRVIYRLTPNDDSLIDFTYDIDWRVRAPVNEGVLTVNLDRWGAPPGYPIELEGFGPPDGRWLIISVRRDWFSPVAEVTIRQPIVPLKEPALEVVTQQPTGGEVGGAGMKLYNECKKISQKAAAYSWGGNHGPSMSSMDYNDGYDCSSSTSFALYKADMWDQGTARVSGQFNTWGQSGRGNLFTVCYTSGHVYIRFEDNLNVDNQRFDTSSWGSDTGGSGPRLRQTEGPPNDSGYALRHWKDL